MREQKEGPPDWAALLILSGYPLQSGFDLEPPSLEQRLGDVFGIFVAPRPLPQPGGAQILIRRELILPHHLLEFGDSGDDWPDGLGLAPVGISASLSHENYASYSYKICLLQMKTLTTLDSLGLARDSHPIALPTKELGPGRNSVADWKAMIL